MDNVVHSSLSSEEQERLKRLQEELEGQELTALLERLQQQLDLSINQMAVTAGMDESAFHKIFKGENREFKAEHVDKLLLDLELQGKLSDANEIAIWKRALRVAAFLHFELYKAAEPRLRRIEDPVKRVEALGAYLREQYPALAETYDKSGGTFPIFVPLFNIVANELNKRWGWVRIPPGYRLHQIKGNRYSLISTDLFPKSITNLGPDVEIEDTGFGTYTVKQRIIQPRSPQVTTSESHESESNVLRMGGMEFMRVLAGPFLMGSTQDNKLAFDNERPQHTVDIPYDYWMARFPITNKQYYDYVTSKWLKHPVDDWEMKSDHPVTRVSWNDAMAYCQWLHDLLKTELPSGLVLRLPTEAEWEKAARWLPSPRGRGAGGEGESLEWPWGNEFDKSKCNSLESGKGGTTPVGHYSPRGDSPYGCADMVGNVWEWTHSLYKPYRYQVDDGRENESASGSRVLRGASFFSLERLARCAFRIDFGVTLFDFSFGFRVVASPVLS